MEDNEDTNSISLASTEEEFWDENAEFQVESVLTEKEENGQKLYLVKWEGYSHAANTWEPEESFQNDIPLENWRIRKLLEDDGSYEPFDLEEWSKSKRHKKTQYKERKGIRGSEKPRIGDVALNRFSRESANSSGDFRPGDLLDPEEPNRVYDDSRRDIMECGQNDIKSLTYGSCQWDRRDLNFPLSSDDGKCNGNSETSARRSVISDSREGVNRLATLQVRSPSSAGTESFNKPTEYGKFHKGQVCTKFSDRYDDVTSNHKKTSGGGESSQVQEAKRSPIEKTRQGPEHGLKAVNKAQFDGDNLGKEPALLKNAGPSPKALSIFSKRHESPSSIREDSFLYRKLDSSGKLSASKEGFYKNSRSRRKAKLRGREEPPPDISEVQFINKDRRSKKSEPMVPSLDILPLNLSSNPTSTQKDTRAVCSLQGVDTERYSETLATEGLFSAFPDKWNLNEERTQSKQLSSSFHQASDNSEATRASYFNRNGKEQTADLRNEISAIDRGNLLKDSPKRAVPIPLDALNRHILDPRDSNYEKYKVLGHVAIGGVQIAGELACSSMSVKNLLLGIKDQRDVQFPLDYLITAEEYWDIFHQTSNVYFGAGEVQGRCDKSLQTSREHAVNNLQNLHDQLSARCSAALYLGPAFSIVMWPSGKIVWSKLDRLFHPNKASTPLRFLVRTAITQPFRSTRRVRFDMRTVPNSGQGQNSAMELLFEILGINWRSMVTNETYQHVFLLYGILNRYEHDILVVFARRMGLQIWSALIPGHWHQFCSKVAGVSGKKGRPVEIEKGLILAHASFRQFRFLPRLFRLLERGVRIFVINSLLRNSKPDLIHDSIQSEFEQGHQSPAALHREIVGCNVDTYRWKVEWEYHVHPKKVVVEIFPAKQGHAVLILDSFFVNDPESTYNFLVWYRDQSRKGKIGAWRLAVRPDICNWVRAIIIEERQKNQDRERVLTWEKIGRIIDALGGQEPPSEESGYEAENSVHYPMILSFHPWTCPGLDAEYPLGRKGNSIDIARRNDEALFEWFGRWSLGEVRLFRRFHVLSGETDQSEYEKMLNNWPRKWRHVSLSQAVEYMHGNKIYDWFSREYQSSGAPGPVTT